MSSITDQIFEIYDKFEIDISYYSIRVKGEMNGEEYIMTFTHSDFNSLEKFLVETSVETVAIVYTGENDSKKNDFMTITNLLKM